MCGIAGSKGCEGDDTGLPPDLQTQTVAPFMFEPHPKDVSAKVEARAGAASGATPH